MSGLSREFVEIAVATSSERLNELIEKWLDKNKLTRDMLAPEDFKIEHIRLLDGSGAVRALVRRDLGTDQVDGG